MLYSITDESIVVMATTRAGKTGYPFAEPRTDIFTIDPGTGRKRLLFSDANAKFLLLPGGSGAQIVVGGGRIFAGGCRLSGQYLLHDSQYSPTGNRGAVYLDSFDNPSTSQEKPRESFRCAWMAVRTRFISHLPPARLY